MISPDTLITAAHCLYEVDDQRWTPKLIFRPSDWSQWSYTFASQKWVSAEYPTTGSADHDWGVVKFSEPISSSWFGIKPSDTSSAFSGQKVTVTRFPGEKGNSLLRDYGQLWTASGILQPGTQTRLHYHHGWSKRFAGLHNKQRRYRHSHAWHQCAWLLWKQCATYQPKHAEYLQ